MDAHKERHLLSVSLFPFTLFASVSDGGASVRDNAHDVCVGSKLPIYFGLSAHPLDAGTYAHGSDLEDQCIAGNHRTAEPRFLDAGKQNQLLIAIFNFSQCQNGPYLSQRFHHQNSRHYRCSGKVALKKGLIDADLLNANDSFPRYELNNSIDQKKGIAMRQ